MMITNNENVDLEKEAAKMPSGMKETAERMMSGQFDMNDMLAQLKQIKKMNNFQAPLYEKKGFFKILNWIKKILMNSLLSRILNIEIIPIQEPYP